MELDYPHKVPVVPVKQPLGEFYVTSLPARLLLEVCYSDPLRVDEKKSSESYIFSGIQRDEREDRLSSIGRYLNTVEAAIPNSIILGANYLPSGELTENSDIRWQIEEREDFLELTIPSPDKVASIIDGQHRLHGFEYAEDNRKDMMLPCSIYIDLPLPYQAFLFATINFNQKKVDRSQAYENWGFNLDPERSNSWSPEKTAVFLCRKLNVDEDSPFYNHIRVVAQNDDVLFRNRNGQRWTVSTATVVDGILRLITTNPQRDRDKLHKYEIDSGRDRSILDNDRSPLRSLYINSNDKAIYLAVRNYFEACSNILWRNREDGSYIVKTIGIQALFDVLRDILLQKFSTDRDLSVDYFERCLSNASSIDFSDPFFQASGLGRTNVKNSIELAIGLKERGDVNPDKMNDYDRLIDNFPQQSLFD